MTYLVWHQLAEFSAISVRKRLRRRWLWKSYHHVCWMSQLLHVVLVAQFGSGAMLSWWYMLGVTNSAWWAGNNLVKNTFTLFLRFGCCDFSIQLACSCYMRVSVRKIIGRLANKRQPAICTGSVHVFMIRYDWISSNSSPFLAPRDPRHWKWKMLTKSKNMKHLANLRGFLFVSVDDYVPASQRTVRGKELVWSSGSGVLRETEADHVQIKLSKLHLVDLKSGETWWISVLLLQITFVFNLIDYKIQTDQTFFQEKTVEYASVILSLFTQPVDWHKLRFYAIVALEV